VRPVIRILAVGLTLAVSLAYVPAQAGTYLKIVDPPNCLNGCNSDTPGVIAQGFDGGLYTTMPTQVYGSGTVVAFSPGLPPGLISTGLPYLPKICDVGSTTGGSVPVSGLTLGIDGSFYGAARNGGSGYGLIFKVTFPNPATAAQTNATAACTPLYPFTNKLDGAYPRGAPVQGPDGNLYGSTSNGTQANGVIYRLNPATLAFTPIAAIGQPLWAPLIVGEDGNLYGVAETGGTKGYGTIFQVTLAGQVATLYNFQGATDGGAPRAPLLWARDGMLYGTTYGGGAGSGVIFRQNPHVVNAYAVVRPFSGTDGAGSQSGLVQGSDGKLYGVAGAGGANGAGTLFAADTAGNAITPLVSFSTPNGIKPLGTPTLHTSGLILGTTNSGGTHGNAAYGVEFSYNAGLKPFASVVGSTRGFPQGVVFGLIGQGFTHATAVTVGTGAANFTVVSDTYLQVYAPGGCSGQVVVSEPGMTVTTPQVVTVGNATLSKFQVCNPVRLPRVPVRTLPH
jgi:uncharacterized repeat protein (TIGR03803 family)